jgi:hypothetical protein
LRTKIEKKREKTQKIEEDFEADLLILNGLSANFAEKQAQSFIYLISALRIAPRKRLREVVKV